MPYLDCSSLQDIYANIFADATNIPFDVARYNQEDIFREIKHVELFLIKYYEGFGYRVETATIEKEIVGLFIKANYRKILAENIPIVIEPYMIVQAYFPFVRFIAHGEPDPLLDFLEKIKIVIKANNNHFLYSDDGEKVEKISLSFFQLYALIKLDWYGHFDATHHSIRFNEDMAHQLKTVLISLPNNYSVSLEPHSSFLDMGHLFALTKRLSALEGCFSVLLEALNPGNAFKVYDFAAFEDKVNKGLSSLYFSLSSQLQTAISSLQDEEKLAEQELEKLLGEALDNLPALSPLALPAEEQKEQKNSHSLSRKRESGKIESIQDDKEDKNALSLKRPCLGHEAVSPPFTLIPLSHANGLAELKDLIAKNPFLKHMLELKDDQEILIKFDNNTPLSRPERAVLTSYFDWFFCYGLKCLRGMEKIKISHLDFTILPDEKSYLTKRIDHLFVTDDMFYSAPANYWEEKNNKIGLFAFLQISLPVSQLNVESAPFKWFLNQLKRYEYYLAEQTTYGFFAKNSSQELVTELLTIGEKLSPFPASILVRKFVHTLAGEIRKTSRVPALVRTAPATQLIPGVPIQTYHEPSHGAPFQMTALHPTEVYCGSVALPSANRGANLYFPTPSYSNHLTDKASLFSLQHKPTTFGHEEAKNILESEGEGRKGRLTLRDAEYNIAQRKMREEGLLPNKNTKEFLRECFAHYSRTPLTLTFYEDIKKYIAEVAKEYDAKATTRGFEEGQFLAHTLARLDQLKQDILANYKEEKADEKAHAMMGNFMKEIEVQICVNFQIKKSKIKKDKYLFNRLNGVRLPESLYCQLAFAPPYECPDMRWQSTETLVKGAILYRGGGEVVHCAPPVIALSDYRSREKRRRAFIMNTLAKRHGDWVGFYGGDMFCLLHNFENVLINIRQALPHFIQFNESFDLPIIFYDSYVREKSVSQFYIFNHQDFLGNRKKLEVAINQYCESILFDLQDNPKITRIYSAKERETFVKKLKEMQHLAITKVRVMLESSIQPQQFLASSSSSSSSSSSFSSSFQQGAATVAGLNSSHQFAHSSTRLPATTSALHHTVSPHSSLPVQAMPASFSGHAQNNHHLPPGSSRCNSAFHSHLSQPHSASSIPPSLPASSYAAPVLAAYTVLPAGQPLTSMQNMNVAASSTASTLSALQQSQLAVPSHQPLMPYSAIPHTVSASSALNSQSLFFNASSGFPSSLNGGGAPSNLPNNRR